MSLTCARITARCLSLSTLHARHRPNVILHLFLAVNEGAFFAPLTRNTLSCLVSPVHVWILPSSHSNYRSGKAWLRAVHTSSIPSGRNVGKIIKVAAAADQTSTNPRLCQSQLKVHLISAQDLTVIYLSQHNVLP